MGQARRRPPPWGPGSVIREALLGLRPRLPPQKCRHAAKLGASGEPPDLLEGALARGLVGPPADQPGPVPEAVAGDLVVADLDHQFGRQRDPFAGALGAPAAGAAGRVAGEALAF